MGKLEELEERLRRLELSQGTAMGTRRSVGEDMDFMGEVNISAANIQVSDPSTGAPRLLMSYRDLYERFGIHAHFAGLDDNGTPQVWIDAQDGAQYWAGGAGSMDGDGLHLDGIRYALEHTATDTAGNNPRRGAIEMYYPDGEIAPAYRLIFSDAGTATELVTNGDFETGDTTGWTTSGTFSVSNGSLSLYPGTAQSTAFAVTAGTSYLIRARVIVRPLVRLDWYNSGGTLISSTTVLNGSWVGSGWQEISANVTAPAGAVQAKVYLATTSTAWFDDISVQARTVLTDLVFADDGIRGLWPEQWHGGWDAAQAFGSNGTRKTMVYYDQPNMWLGYYASLIQADASNGDWYVLKIPLAAGTYEWRMNYRSETDRGRVDLYVNGVKVSGATPFDMYATTAANNQAWTVSSIVIPKHGVHEFKVVVNGQHASSSDYRVAASFITIRRTG